LSPRIAGGTLPEPDGFVFQELEQGFQVMGEQLDFHLPGCGRNVTAINAGTQPVLDDFLLWIGEGYQVFPKILVLFGQ
jgi:hypothetical protein